MGNPDVRCHSHSKTRTTGLSVVRAAMFMVRRGGSCQRGNDDIDQPSSFLHGDIETSSIPMNKNV